MGILIQFPQPGTRIPPGEPPSSQASLQDERLAPAYQRDLDRAVALLIEHVQSGAYDGVALILKPKSTAHKPALVVGGVYRHKLDVATDAAMQLHLAIKLRAREQAPPQACASRNLLQRSPNIVETITETNMDKLLEEQWNDAIARYRRCEQMLRITFSKHLRASPETTSILLSITQLHIETVANCLWELVHQPGQKATQARLDTLNAIQLFRRARAKVSAWMPPFGQEAIYFSVNTHALTEEIVQAGATLLSDVEDALNRAIEVVPFEYVGT